MPEITFVVAVARNGVIGRDGAMPWHLPADLRHFKAMTMGKPIIMGRKTYESIGRPLPGRDTVVITRQSDFAADGVADGVHVTGSWDEARALGVDLAQRRGVDEIAVVGGAEIYALAMADADRIYLTEIDIEPDGDAKFPALDPRVWRETGREEHAKESDRPSYRFINYDRTEQARNSRRA